MPQRDQRPYPPEFRREAVSLVKASGRSIREVAVELGVSTESLRIWLRQDQLDRGERDDGLTSDEREELRKLRRQVRELEQGARDSEASGDFLRAGDRSAVSMYRLVEHESQRQPVFRLCRTLGVTRSGYYDWQRQPLSDRALADWLLTAPRSRTPSSTQPVCGCGRRR
jgi:transposase